jgi:hypothetical protein
MLMVLMALVEFGKGRVHKASRWLWLLLSGGVAAAPVGCGSSSPGPGVGDAGELAAMADLPAGDFPQALYGAQADVPGEADAADAKPDSGPATKDAVDAADALPDVSQEAGPDATVYGPVTCQGDADCGDWVCGPDGYCVAPGTPDAAADAEGTLPDAAVDAEDALPDVVLDCQPIMVAYGAGMVFCTSDADCTKALGQGWYCGPGVDPCNRLCEAVANPEDAVDVADALPDVVLDCQPLAVAYGVILYPCTTDADCASHGSRWYCDTTTDPCNPSCRQGP